jgi:uncharacterized LabA/DUF88 family protein
VPLLRAVIVMDYQNVHLTAHGLFARHEGLAKHESLIHPLHFANQIIRTRNQRQQPGMAHAELKKVLVYRGEPSPEHSPNGHRRNQMQKAEWERDPRVKVTLRPLKYDYEYDASGRPVTDGAGNRIVKGKPREKGIDVLCALALLREARQPDIDVVILAAQDTDLVPALDEAIQLNAAKIETFSWYEPDRPQGRQQLRPEGRRIWNTRLGKTEFMNCQDTNDYT